MMHSYRRTATLLLAACSLIVLPCTALHAAEAPAKQPTNLEIVRAAEALGGLDRAKRRAAEALLKRAGPAALAALKEAADNPNKLAAARALEIIDYVRLGVRPDTPDDIRALAGGFHNEPDDMLPIILRRLAESGPHGLHALRTLTMGQDGRERILAQMTENWQTTIPDLLRAGKHDEAEAMLWVAAMAGRREATLPLAPLLVIMKRAERAANELTGWQAFRQTPIRAFNLALLHNANGQAKQAASAAGILGDAQLPALFLRIGGHWKDLAALRARQPISATEPHKTWGLVATCSRFAGNDEHFRNAMDSLQRAAAGNEKVAMLVQPMLALNGRMDGNVAMLIKEGLHEQAQTMLLDQGKVDEAVKLDAQILQTIAEEEPGSLGTLMRMATFHHECGADKKAKELLIKAAALVDPTTEAIHIAILSRLEHALGMTDEATAHCLAALTRNEDRERDGALLATALATTPGEAFMWWKFLRDKYAAEAEEKTLDRLVKLQHRRMTAKEFRPLAADALKAAARMTAVELPVDAEGEPIAPLLEEGQEPRDHQTEWLATVGFSCTRYGVADLAEQAFRQCYKRTKEPAYLRIVATMKLDSQQWVDAEKTFAAVLKALPADTTSLYGQGFALAQSGKKKEGEALMKTARLLTVFSSGRFYPLARAMDQCAEFDAADEQRSLVAQTGMLSDIANEMDLRVQIERAQENGRWAYAQLLTERLAFGVLDSEPTVRSIRACLLTGNRAAAARIATDLAAGKKDEARKAAQAFAAFTPGDVDSMICLVNAFDKAGLKDDADALFAATYAVRTAGAKAWPNRANAHNNMAWTASQCGRKLDEALVSAKRAVALAPTLHAYLDTLASVHYARKEYAEAVTWEEECLRLNPRSPFTIWQLAKFRTALRKSQ